MITVVSLPFKIFLTVTVVFTANEFEAPYLPLSGNSPYLLTAVVPCQLDSAGNDNASNANARKKGINLFIKQSPASLSEKIAYGVNNIIRAKAVTFICL